MFSKSKTSFCLFLYRRLFSTTANKSSSNVVTPSKSLSERFSVAFPQIDLADVRKEFRELKGGKVSLSKDEENGIAFICLDHPEKKNGFSGSMMVDLNEIVSSLEGWSTGKAVILHGKGDAFCSGGYLETVKKIANPNDGYKMSSLMQDSVIRLSKLPMVSTSVVHGPALGGGAELMLSTDFRLFTSSAHCRFVEARMGVGTGWGGGTLLKKIVGSSRALDLLLSCRKISAEDAIAIGLAEGLVSEGNALEEATKWTLTLVGQHDHSVVQTIKQIIASNSFEEEKTIFATSWGGPAQKDALSKNVKHKD